MGSDAGQPLSDIIRRKEMERQCGDGVFAWGIGNSVGPAIKYAKLVGKERELDALFTPMKAAPKAIDVSPSLIVMWLGYFSSADDVELLPEHMLITSRGQFGNGDEKKVHYALICRSGEPLTTQQAHMAIDHRAVRNLVSSNPVGASQVTSIVRYRSSDSRNATYSVVFRAKLTEQAFVRLAVPVALTHDLLDLYRKVCAARDSQEWRLGIKTLKEAAHARWPREAQLSFSL